MSDVSALFFDKDMGVAEIRGVELEDEEQREGEI